MFHSKHYEEQKEAKHVVLWFSFISTAFWSGNVGMPKDDLPLVCLLEHMESIFLLNSRLCKTSFNTKPEYNINICSVSL